MHEAHYVGEEALEELRDVFAIELHQLDEHQLHQSHAIVRPKLRGHAPGGVAEKSLQSDSVRVGQGRRKLIDRMVGAHDFSEYLLFAIEVVVYTADGL